MKMKSKLFLLCTLTYLLNSCTPVNHCISNGNYIKTVDTLNPYKIDGKYCIENTHDTYLENEMSIVSIKVFDRRNGKLIHGGIAWFYNDTDTLQLLLESGFNYKKLSAGNYIVGISASNSGLLGFSTKRKLDFHKNSKTEINIYLGSSLQW